MAQTSKNTKASAAIKNAEDGADVPGNVLLERAQVRPQSSLLRELAEVSRNGLVQDSRGILIRAIDGDASLQPCNAGVRERLEWQVCRGKTLWE